MAPEEVRALRVSRGHSLTTAAHLAGVSRRTWIRWEQGKARPDLARIELYRREIRVQKNDA